MPCMPKFLIIRHMIKNEKISAEDQKEYYSGIGILLFLAEHSGPDITNMAKQLSNTNDGVNTVT